MDHSHQGDQPARKPAAASGQAEDPQRSKSEFETADDSAVDAERLEKIDNLTKAVADGTYQVSAEEVARKVIEHMRQPKD